MHKAQSWRTLLGMIASEPKNKQRILEELGITPITLTRWVSGESDPRPQNLRHLISILPQYREQLLGLLKEERGGDELPNPIEETGPTEIPADFYAQVFITRASTTPNLRSWKICMNVLQHAIEQLDPERQGMSIWVVYCMPPSGPFNKVRSLRETVGVGTSPWKGILEKEALFLGAESLTGSVVTQCRPAITQDLEQDHHLMPSMRVENELSAAIYPILYAGRIGGALLVSSTQREHFLSQIRTTLIQQYTDLVALAFEPEDFYAPDDIALGVMPKSAEQKPYIAKHYRDFHTETAGENTRLYRPTNYVQTDLHVWQKFEDKLLEIGSRTKDAQETRTL